VYEISQVIVVPSIQYRKADQSDGRAMGVIYSRGLTFCFLFWSTECLILSFTSCPGGLMGVHRAEFHEVLLNHLSSRCRALPSKRLESYVQRPGAPIMLRFQDGSTTTCDILVGADGLRSAVRKTMFHEAAMWAESQHRNADAAQLRSLSEPLFSGVFSYRALIPGERLSSISPQHRVLSSAVQVSRDLLNVSDHGVLLYAVPRQE
jgi:salicylate hydroxylase